MSVPGQRVTIVAEQNVVFQVEEWLPNTSAEDKKKPVIWMRQTHDRKIILFQVTSTTGYKFYILKKFCGSYHYYVEASFSGQRDFKNNVGLYVKGWCEPKIISSKWSYQKGGASIKNNKKAQHISYGHIVHLNLQTEGLNGNNLIIELWNQQYAKADKQICVYTDVQVIDGEVNLKIQNSYAWMAHVDNIQNLEEFYIKVKDQASGKYIKDNLGDDLHAIYLNVKNKIATTNTNVSQNQTPTKVYKPDVNSARIEPCKFEVIKFTENVVKDGKASNSTVTVFDNGKGLKPIKARDESIHRTIYYKFDSTEIDKDGLQVLNNILKFLLEHKGSTINLSGYACVIGKINYNKGLSQRRADVVKKFFADGGLDGKRIFSVGKGEVDPTDDKMGRDNIKYKNEKDYEDNRRVDISFIFNAHDAQTIIYEVVAPSISTKKRLTVDISGYDTKACFRGANKHKKESYIVDVGQSIDKGDTRQTFATPSFNYSVYSDLSKFNAFPVQYIWPMSTNPNQFHLHLHSCRYFSNEKRTTVLINAYPDVKWTIEFKWNHTQPFAYSYGNKLHPHDLKTGRNKVIGFEVDRGWSKNFGEMAQSFELSLAAEWDKKSQKAEFGKEFGERIAKTLGLFNKIKSMTEKVSNSPLTKGKIMFEIKSPIIAVSAQWYLQKALPKSSNITTIVEVGISAKPLVEASFTINLFKLFIEYGGNILCPGAGKVITWVMDKLETNVGIHFLVIFAGGIYIDGKTTINISYPKETKGEIKTTGKIQVTIEFKAWAKGGSANMGVEGVIKADANTSVSGGIKVGADKQGIYAAPVAEFGGIKATFVAAATVKFGIFKRKFSYNDEAIIVEPDEIKFDKKYINL